MLLGESTSRRLLVGTIAVALHARDEQHLVDIACELRRADLGHHVVREPRENRVDEAMAIGLEPTTDREAVRKVLSKLPLVR